MKTIFTNDTVVVIILMILIACEKNDVGSNATPPPVMVLTTSVAGRVTDLKNAPVSGASVEVGGSVTITDSNGQFILKEMQLDMKGLEQGFKADGYVFANYLKEK